MWFHQCGRRQKIGFLSSAVQAFRVRICIFWCLQSRGIRLTKPGSVFTKTKERDYQSKGADYTQRVRGFLLWQDTRGVCNIHFNQKQNYKKQTNNKKKTLSGWSMFSFCHLWSLDTIFLVKLTSQNTVNASSRKKKQHIKVVKNYSSQTSYSVLLH